VKGFVLGYTIYTTTIYVILSPFSVAKGLFDSIGHVQYYALILEYQPLYSAAEAYSIAASTLVSN
jgi:isoprenylcysteine carboxyl methyltransferase (ICMT) family protein YpbQ